MHGRRLLNRKTFSYDYPPRRLGNFYEKYLTAQAAKADARPPSEILPYLFLGNKRHAVNRNELKANGITHVLVVADELEAYFPADFTYRQLRVRDTDTEPVGEVFHEACNFIDGVRTSENPSRVLVRYNTRNPEETALKLQHVEICFSALVLCTSSGAHYRTYWQMNSYACAQLSFTLTVVPPPPLHQSQFSLISFCRAVAYFVCMCRFARHAIGKSSFILFPA